MEYRYIADSTAKEYRTERGYLRGIPRFGRTTKLVLKSTGEVVFEGMGLCSKKSLIYTHNQVLLRKNGTNLAG